MEIKEDFRDDDSDESLKLRGGNISLVLHSYNALFSDFDPRPYSERGLSDDFIIECKRAVRDREGITELRLLMPAQLRKAHEEIKIKKRLVNHFRKHFKLEEKEISGIRRNGIIWFFIGSIILMISTFLYEYKITGNEFLKFFFNFLVIISQPAGWFTFWEALNMIFVYPREHRPDYIFYKKMANANIYFLNY